MSRIDADSVMLGDDLAKIENDLLHMVIAEHDGYYYQLYTDGQKVPDHYEKVCNYKYIEREMIYRYPAI